MVPRPTADLSDMRERKLSSEFCTQAFIFYVFRFNNERRTQRCREAIVGTEVQECIVATGFPA